MIKTTAMLLEELKGYGSPKSKLARMAERGECFPITRGLYETDRNAPAYLLAGSIYGPSYISFEYALSRYGLIPEAVYAVTCATFEKKKKKKYETPFGTFTYRDVPSEAFPLGIRLVQEGDYFYRIAEPEKALCDQLYTMPPVPNTQELFRLLTALRSRGCCCLKTKRTTTRRRSNPSAVRQPASAARYEIPFRGGAMFIMQCA